MGIHINGDHNSVNVYGDVYGDSYGDSYGDNYGGPPSGPPIGFFGLAFVAIILICLVIKFWWVVLIVASVAALAFGTWLEREEKKRGALEAQRREAALAARAERQNSAYLEGDPWGMYGNFPPPPGVGQ
jgi:hypothetical protein